MEPSTHPERAGYPCFGKARFRRNDFDWISEPRTANITPFQQSIVDIDWTKSPLGPMKDWPAQLRHMVLIVVADSTPAVLYWGDRATIVYNEAYIGLIQEKHPALQGQDPRIGFAELWDHFEQLLAKQRENGQTFVAEDAMIMIQRRDGLLEEAYFNWKFVPVIGDEGYVVGSHATVVEVSREIIADRRSSTIRTLNQDLSQAKTVKDVWRLTMQGLEAAKKDVPMALLYSVLNYQPSYRGAKQDPVSCVLEGSTGLLPSGDFLAPDNIDLTHDQNWLSSLFQKAITAPKPFSSHVPEEIHESFQSIGLFTGVASESSVVVCPIRTTNSSNIMAFLVIGLSSVLPYNEDYQQFVHSLTEQVTIPHVSSVMLQQEVERRLHVAEQEAVDKARLSRELSDIESKFIKFSARAPIGLAILTEAGHALSANDLWKELVMLEVDSNAEEWSEVLVEGHYALVMEKWGQMLETRESVSLPIATKRPWKSPVLDEHGNAQWTDTHILLALFPDLDDIGNIKSVMSCITDISELKWTEAQLRNRMNEAIKMQKQQEKFIDMTSHEMRNPLSALIGCADEIITSLTDYRSHLEKQGRMSVDDSALLSGSHANALLHSSLVDDAIEAADTIIYCAMHQKRIIDDILTLSRLDSDLLVTCPEASEPIQIIKSALKMFESELKQAGTKLDFTELESLQTLNVKWTLLDPSRVLQVFINLMTNAIKFTRTEPHRHITISMGASLAPPSETDGDVEYVPKSKSNKDHTSAPDWGDGEIIYLTITVKDTGRGLSKQERENLFRLFQQASPKTHVQYGGSGLGLFISRQLAEMQGGQIGVASEQGKGTTFQFYVKTRRSGPSVDEFPKTADIQLLVRQDAIREACGIQMPALQNGTTVSNMQIQDLTKGSEIPGVRREGGLHILVVEDNLVNQKVVTKQLRKSGHTVSVANHGEEALDILRRSEYWMGSTEGQKLSVVLMDLEMPVMDGITCVKQIRELQTKGEIRGHVPVIAVTANARKDQILTSLNAGMDDVTTKPYRMQDMLKQIERLAIKYKQRIDLAQTL